MSLLACASSNRKLASAGECNLQRNLRENSRQSCHKIAFASDVDFLAGHGHTLTSSATAYLPCADVLQGQSQYRLNNSNIAKVCKFDEFNQSHEMESNMNRNVSVVAVAVAVLHPPHQIFGSP